MSERASERVREIERLEGSERASEAPSLAKSEYIAELISGSDLMSLFVSGEKMSYNTYKVIL